MNPVQIIQSKRDGNELTQAEITFFITGYLAGSIPDYQMSALAMAIYFRGMTPDETAFLTECMFHSGEVLERLGDHVRVDKHSTGGIGDKVSLILAPLLACCDVHVPMIAGRGLGPSGGTLDKLESIPGFRTDLSPDEIQTNLARVGCVITGQTATLAPADRKLYALRDVTGTVQSIPLITASILCKKLAENLDGLVMDVKTGSGAFIKSLEGSRALATSLEQTAHRLGLPVSTLITDMNQPLGRMVGNSVEVMEALSTLRGEGPKDMRDVTLALAARALLAVHQHDDMRLAVDHLEKLLDNGQAYERFEQMVQAQGGQFSDALEIAPEIIFSADEAGYVQQIDGEKIGYAVIALGGGRKQLSDSIDPAVGLEMLVRLGDRVEVEQPLVRCFARSRGQHEAQSLIRQAIVIGDEPIPAPPLIHWSSARMHK